MTTEIDAEGLALAPCPFCGGEAKMIRPMGDRLYNKDADGKAVPPFYGPDWFRVVCEGAGCNAIANAFPTEVQAIAAWNRRALPTPVSDDQVEALNLAAAALSPFASAVFNDNGDLTIDASAPTSKDLAAAYFALRKVRAALAAMGSTKR